MHVRFFKIEVPDTLLDEANHIGSFRGFDLFVMYMPAAKYSPRAIVYVYVKSKDSGNVAFTQASTIRRAAFEDFPEVDVERWLTLDALSRAKHRILQRVFSEGEAYAIELSGLRMV